MSTSEILRAKAIEISSTDIVVYLDDGTRHAAPIAMFPILADATAEERVNWKFIADNSGIHWPEIDEHISVFSIVYPEETLSMRPEAAERHIQKNRDRRTRSA